MKTRYEEIVHVPSIGTDVNPIKLNDILSKATSEGLKPASQNAEQVLLIAIDVQRDFMDTGALGVPGANGDIERATKWMYDNMDKIARVAVSIDTHNPFQIFHPCWWIDKDGNNPAPFTAITVADLDAGKWRALIDPVKSRDYVENLEKLGKKVLVIWPYHCIGGTPGHALDGQFSNMLYYFSVAKKSIINSIHKGQDPFSEMYGIIKPEYDTKNYVNLDFLNALEKYDKVVIFGEAASHCVMESIRQMLEYYENRPEITNRVFVLEDCTSAIPGFETQTQAAFSEFKKKYKINLVKSTAFSL